MQNVANAPKQKDLSPMITIAKTAKVDNIAKMVIVHFVLTALFGTLILSNAFLAITVPIQATPFGPQRKSIYMTV